VNTAYYARIVMELAAKRRLAEAGTRLAQLAQEADGTAEEILSRAEAELARAGAHLRPPEDDGAMDIGAFAQEDLPFGAEVIPGLLREQERVITVAAEGSGKTYLAMQVAVMSAAGLHVFSQDAIEPVRTLMVDLENPSATAQRRSRMLLAQAERVPGWDAGRCWIWSKPGGLDLREPSDQRRLLNVIDRAGPSLIVAGPVYKMSVDRGERGEQLHGSVTTFWDGVRERLGAALWLEHHAPLGQGTRRDMRPVGTALWLRWCEFGLALTPNLDRRGSLNVGTFRGHREEGRMWPYRLDRGEPWPWSAVYPNGTF
jgi:replicative DNA helicase